MAIKVVRRGRFRGAWFTYTPAQVQRAEKLWDRLSDAQFLGSRAEIGEARYARLGQLRFRAFRRAMWMQFMQGGSDHE